MWTDAKGKVNLYDFAESDVSSKVKFHSVRVGLNYKF